MRIAPRESAVRAVATQLDRAITDTARNWTILIPFVLIDSVTSAGNLVFAGPVMAAVLYVVANRAFVITFEILATGKRFAWMATFRYPRALWFALLEPLDALPLGLVVVAIVTPFAVIQSGRLLMYGAFGETLGMIVVVLLCCLIGILAVTLVLVILAAYAAMIDVVADGSSARRSFGVWLRRCFRWRTLGSTLLAGTIMLLLYTGVTNLTNAIPTPNHWVHALVMGLPDGAADGLSLVYLWHWRRWRLNLDRGYDLAAELRPIDQTG